MRNPIEGTLYEDAQQEVPGDYCPVCGGARYWPGLHCLRCERRELYDFDGIE